MLNFLTSVRQLIHLLRLVWNGSAWEHLGSMATSGPQRELTPVPVQSDQRAFKLAIKTHHQTPCRADPTRSRH